MGWWGREGRGGASNAAWERRKGRSGQHGEGENEGEEQPVWQGRKESGGLVGERRVGGGE